MSNLFVDKLLGPKASSLKTSKSDARPAGSASKAPDLQGAIDQARLRQQSHLGQPSTKTSERTPNAAPATKSGAVAPSAPRQETKGVSAQSPSSISRSSGPSPNSATPRQSAPVGGQRALNAQPGQNRTGAVPSARSAVPPTPPTPENRQGAAQRPVARPMGLPRGSDLARAPSPKQQSAAAAPPSTSMAASSLASAAEAGAAKGGSDGYVNRQPLKMASPQAVSPLPVSEEKATPPVGDMVGRKLPQGTGVLGKSALLAPAQAQGGGQRKSRAAELIAQKKAEITADHPGVVARRGKQIVDGSGGVNDGKIGTIRTDLQSHQIEELIEKAGNLLTGPGGILERRPEQREIMALFESGLLLVSKFHVDDPHISSFVGLLRRKGMTVDVVTSDLGLISKCYDERDEGGSEGVVRADDEATSMQKDIVRFIGECARLKASDAHIVVDPTSTRVRLRVDGILRDYTEWRSAYGADFCAAAFAMADASDASYQPYEYQAARISDTSVRLPAGVQALRLQFNPLSYGGRHLVMRFLYRSSGNVGDVDTLGYAQKQIFQIKRIRATPMGINIVAGPTGSGKSTTLQRILTTLMRERKNEISVFTVEDPPEYVIAGAQQMPVTNASTAEERKEKFNAAIRAALRSDPDVIMIGEIRDHESAKLAFEAAMTGHQVWATLHAVDCLTIISRLKDIGVDEYKLFDPAVFTGLIGQRLLRALCNNCKIPVRQARDQGEIKDDLWERIVEVFGRDLDGIYHQGKGCSACGNSGCKGRSVVAEVLLPDDSFMEQMRAENKVGARRYWIDSLSGLTMLGHGILKAAAGEVSPEEVERMLGLLELDRVRAPTTPA